MKQFEKFIVPAAIVVGLIGGYFYWKYIGCTSGTCPITSQWHLTTLYGGALGYVLGDFVKGIVKKKSNEQVSENNK